MKVSTLYLMDKMQQPVRVLPLAPKPLSTPHPYEPAYEVLVQLDEPLWLPRQGPRDVAVEIISLCVQLDSIILSHCQEEKERNKETEVDMQRKVTFEKLLAGKSRVIFQQMQELLERAGIKTTLEDYFCETGIRYLFPRVELYYEEPDQPLDQVSSPVMDGYIMHMTNLNNVMTMAQQLNSNLLSSPSHKYIAHETALLYQCLGYLPQLAHFKKDIEGHFSALKACCVQSPQGHPPRLTGELKTWLLNLTQCLLNQTLSSHELFTSDAHVCEVLTTIHNIPPISFHHDS